jgi:hypothetical protein
MTQNQLICVQLLRTCIDLRHEAQHQETGNRLVAFQAVKHLLSETIAARVPQFIGRVNLGSVKKPPLRQTEKHYGVWHLARYKSFPSKICRQKPEWFSKTTQH